MSVGLYENQLNCVDYFDVRLHFDPCLSNDQILSKCFAVLSGFYSELFIHCMPIPLPFHMKQKQQQQKPNQKKRHNQLNENHSREPQSQQQNAQSQPQPSTSSPLHPQINQNTNW